MAPDLGVVDVPDSMTRTELVAMLTGEHQLTQAEAERIADDSGR